MESWGAPLAHENNSIVLEDCRHFRPNAGKFWIKWANFVHREKTPLFRSLIIPDNVVSMNRRSLFWFLYSKFPRTVAPAGSCSVAMSSRSVSVSSSVPVHRTFLKGFNAEATRLGQFGSDHVSADQHWPPRAKRCYGIFEHMHPS